MIVAVPYFIGIVVTYVVMLGGHDMSVQCFRYCESIGGIVNPQGANEEVTLFARDGMYLQSTYNYTLNLSLWNIFTATYRLIRMLLKVIINNVYES